MIMNGICEKCKHRYNCRPPYQSDDHTQKSIYGRTFTIEEWEKDGYCDYFKLNKETTNGN